jgi:hypothetical protein
VGQRSALSIPTWILPASALDHLFLLVVAFLPVATIVPLLAWAASRLLAPLAHRTEVRTHATLSGLGPWLLLGQAAVPVALAAFSLLVQPSTQPRYWIVGSLAAAPVVALAASRSQRAIRWSAGLALIAVSGSIVAGEGLAGRERRSRLQEDILKAEHATADGSLLVVRRRHSLYPLVRAVPLLAERTALFDASGLGGRDQRLAIVERDVSRVHRRLYGFPRIVAPIDLERIESFYFLELDSTRAPSTTEFPRYDISKVETRLFRLRRQPTP